MILDSLSARKIPQSGSDNQSGGEVTPPGSVFAGSENASKTGYPTLPTDLMERVCDRKNLNQAVKKVRLNKGSPGIDGMSVDDLRPWLLDNGRELRSSLLAGLYKPTAIKRVEIRKPSGGIRKLGIPTVLDRFVQQALLQVLVPHFDPHFSESSFGFRPNRSAHDAVLKAKSYVDEGFDYCVDLDLDSFFDRVNHDRLMSKLSRSIGDKRVLRLIRGFLESGVLVSGSLEQTKVGTPQGGPLSPFLSNVVLDDLDKELERRGLRFCRYADDTQIFVGSEKSADRVLGSVSKFIEVKLKLKVNEKKSGFCESGERKFLGFLISAQRISVSKEAIRAFRGKIRQITKRRRPTPIEARISKLNSVLQGWSNYFGIAQVKYLFKILDGWVRRRIRAVWYHFGKRVFTRVKALIALGVPKKSAWVTCLSGKSSWRMSRSPALHQGLSLSWFEAQGLKSLSRV